MDFEICGMCDIRRLEGSMYIYGRGDRRVTICEKCDGTAVEIYRSWGANGAMPFWEFIAKLCKK